MGLFFDWDPHKASLNERKHEVSFNEAATVFSDRQLLIMSDPDHSENEERFIAIGTSSKGRALLVVAQDISDDRLRLISAGKTTASERRDYEQR
jgi:uncharacterized DUF497 family protein